MVASACPGREEEATVKDYAKYLPVFINRIRVAAFVDSGNTWRSLISEKFARTLGIFKKDLQAIPGQPDLNTAKEGAKLEVLGEPKDSLRLTIKHSGISFPFRPVVVQGLSMPLNLSGPFLQTHRIDQLHSRGCLEIRGTLVPLYSRLSAAPSVANVYVQKATNAAAGERFFVTVVAKEVQNGIVAPGDGCYSPGADYPVRGLYCPEETVVRVRPNGTFMIVFENRSGGRVTLRNGLPIGSFIKGTRDRNQWLQSEDMVCFTGTPRTPQVKKSEYFQEFVRKANQNTLKHKGVMPARGQSLLSMTKAQQREWLKKTFQLAKKPCLSKPKDLARAVEVLMEFVDLFSLDGSYGHTNLITHRIITENVHPIKQKYRPLNPALEPDFRRQLDEWLKHGVVEPADSPWSANLVPVKKKGGKIRYCVDWRALNQVTKKDAYPMPTVHETIARLAGSTIYSGVDMAGAFHCIDIHPADREKTAFATPFGSFQQRRLGFGVTNGPATYCRLVDKVLRGIPASVAISFLDDGVIHSDTLEKHFYNLRITLRAYRDAGLKLAPHKCSFFAPEITYLGHTINQHGIRPTDSYLDAVKKWPLPQFKTEARAFLGTTGYYRAHIHNYARMAAPWMAVVGKTTDEDEKKRFQVTEEMEASFHQLKKALVEAPILGFPYFHGPKAGRFILDTDFSGKQIGAVLSQNQEGREVVIAYHSKKLNAAQSNYPSTKGELYAGLFFMEKFRYYLQHGPRFIWRTDNSALTAVHKMEPRGAIVERWLSTLADFDFTVQHRAGTKHGNADGLSRGAYAPVLRATAQSLWVSALGEFSVDEALTASQLAEEQREDRVLRHVYHAVQEGRWPDALEMRGLHPEVHVYKGIRALLSINQEGVLVRRVPSGNNDLRPDYFVPCLPGDRVEQAIRLAHVTGGHMGRDVTAARLRRRVYFPRLNAQVAEHVGTCLDCQAKGGQEPDQRHTLISPGANLPLPEDTLGLRGAPGRQPDVGGQMAPHLQGCLHQVARVLRPADRRRAVRG
jgi:hypothetical protein